MRKRAQRAMIAVETPPGVARLAGILRRGKSTRLKMTNKHNSQGKQG